MIKTRYRRHLSMSWLPILFAGLGGLVLPSSVQAQMSIGSGSSLTSRRPSNSLGRFSTGVTRNLGARGGVDGRGSQYGKSGPSGRVGRAGRESLDGRNGRLSGGLGTPDQGGGGFSGATSRKRHFGRRYQLRTSAAYGGGGARPLPPTVVDVLARGGSLAHMPTPTIGEGVFAQSTRTLPTIFGSPTERSGEWAEMAFDSQMANGQARLRKMDYTAARSSFDIARTIDPDAFEPRVGLIQTELLVGHYRRATQLIRNLGRRTPEALASGFDVVIWHESQDRYDEFLRRFRQEIVDTTKAGEMVRVLMGFVAWTTGEREQALSQMKQAAAQVSHEEAWVNLIRVLETPVKARASSVTSTSDLGELPPL